MSEKPRIDAAAIFGGVKDVKGKKSGNYVQPGGYIMFIKAIRLDKNRKDEVFVAVEMKVIHTIFTETDDENVVVSHKAGQDASHLMMQKFDMFLPNIKSMVSALTGCAEDDVDESICSEMIGDDQPMANLLIELHARGIITKQNREFTDVTYVGVVSKEKCEELGCTVPENAITAEAFKDPDDDEGKE